MNYKALTTQIWLSNKAEINHLMSTNYPDPYVWYGAIHEPDESANHKPHSHIVLFVPEDHTANDLQYTHDEGTTCDLKWKPLRVQNGLIYPYHLKYSRTNDCFLQVEKKTRVLSENCFGIITEVPDTWYMYWDYLPFNEDDLTLSGLENVGSSAELLVYLKKNRRRVGTMDCRKIMDMMRIYDYIENSVKRSDPADECADKHMQNFLDNL